VWYGHPNSGLLRGTSQALMILGELKGLYTISLRKVDPAFSKSARQMKARQFGLAYKSIKKVMQGDPKSFRKDEEYLLRTISYFRSERIKKAQKLWPKDPLRAIAGMQKGSEMYKGFPWEEDFGVVLLRWRKDPKVLLLQTLLKEFGVIDQDIQTKGSVLPRNEAEDHIKHFNDILKRGSGLDMIPAQTLFNKIHKEIRQLNKSYSTVGFLGVVFVPGIHQTARLAKVMSNGSAAKAGIKAGDAIIEVNGKVLKGRMFFSLIKRNTKPGDKMKLKIQRPNQDPFEVTLVLGRSMADWVKTTQ